MSPDREIHDVVIQLRDYLREVDEFMRKDIPPYWDRDAFTAWEDRRDELLQWKGILRGEIEEELNKD